MMNDYEYHHGLNVLKTIVFQKCLQIFTGDTQAMHLPSMTTVLFSAKTAASQGTLLINTT